MTCKAPWSSGCKKHDVEVILVDHKTGKRFDVCHACWSKVPKTWEWGKRRKKMSKEEKKAMACTNWKWDEIIVHEKVKSEDYIPFAKKEGKVVAWVHKDAMKEKSIEEIIKESEEQEAKKYLRKKKKRKRRKKKRR